LYSRHCHAWLGSPPLRFSFQCVSSFTSNSILLRNKIVCNYKKNIVFEILIGFTYCPLSLIGHFNLISKVKRLFGTWNRFLRNLKDRTIINGFTTYIFMSASRITPEINNLSSAFDWSQSDVNVNSHIDLLSTSIYYKSQLKCGYINGTLKYKFGLKLRCAKMV
jgi:hypothetical protein